MRPLFSTTSVRLAAAAAFVFSLSLPAQRLLAQDDKAEKEESAEATEPRDQETALKEFKADMAALKKWVAEQKEASESNPMVGLKLIQLMDARIKKIRTDGLPADLGTEFKTMTGLIGKMAGIFKGMPEEEGEMMTWLQNKGSDPEFREKMELIGQEINKTGEKLKEIGKKYGLAEVLDIDGKDGEEKAGDDKEAPEEDPVVEEK